MRIYDVQQGSEAWQALRKKPTASNFDRFITPARGDYSEKQARAYAAEIVAKRLGVYTEPPPSFWMQWGMDNEANARHAYEVQTGSQVTLCGFAEPDNTSAYGFSPDGLVGDKGLFQAKCPKPETLIKWRTEGVFPVEYRPQVQGELMISEREWCDFVGFHPELELFVVRVFPDIEYQIKIAECLLKLLEDIQRVEERNRRHKHELVCISTATRDYSMRGFDDE